MKEQLRTELLAGELLEVESRELDAFGGDVVIGVSLCSATTVSSHAEWRLPRELYGAGRPMMMRLL